MITKPKTSTPSAPPGRKPAAIPDPVFALIAEHKALDKKWGRLYTKLDDAELEARKAHGMRPVELVAWRDHPSSRRAEIDRYYDEFLSLPGADRKQIEMEYLDAKTRLCAAKRAGIEWDRRTGIAPLRKQLKTADLAAHKVATRMARTKPTTPAGAAALVDYVWRDIKDDFDESA